MWKCCALLFYWYLDHLSHHRKHINSNNGVYFKIQFVSRVWKDSQTAFVLNSFFEFSFLLNASVAVLCILLLRMRVWERRWGHESELKKHQIISCAQSEFFSDNSLRNAYCVFVPILFCNLFFSFCERSTNPCIRFQLCEALIAHLQSVYGRWAQRTWMISRMSEWAIACVSIAAPSPFFEKYKTSLDIKKIIFDENDVSRRLI